MYYIIYPLLYLLSLLPFGVLHFISDGLSALMFHVVKYRKTVVLNNLQIAFPDKTQAERNKICREFYRYFTDTVLESIKFISISKKALLKRCTIEHETINNLADAGYSINLVAGHQFNWEFVNHITAIYTKIPFVGVYMPFSNKAVNRIFFDMRKRYGTVLVGATEFKNRAHEIFRTQYAIGLAADQNPGNPSTAYWVNFFGRPTPFITGPEKGAIKMNTAVVFVGFHRIKRGYFHFSAKELSRDAKNTKKGELTLLYKNALEAHIKKDPANYLWSHKRFKYEWKAEYGEILG